MVDFNQFITDLTTIGGGTPHMIGYAQNAQSGYIEAPTNAQQQDGVVPLDRLPAQWWNWFLNQATRRFSEVETYIEKAVQELDGILDVIGVSPDATDPTQLKTMFGSTYLQSFLPKIVSSSTAFSVDGTHESSLLVADDDGNNGFAVKKVPYGPPLVVNTQITTAAKNISLPANCPFDGESIKVVFVNGHQAGNATDHMTIDMNNSGVPIPVVSNQNGTLDYLPIHELTAGTYSVLQNNTALEMYYTETGFSGNPAWVVVCNPVVLTGTGYKIYADGFKAETPVDAVTLGDMRPPTSNSVYGTFDQAYTYIRNQNTLGPIGGLAVGTMAYDGISNFIVKNYSAEPYYEVYVNSDMYARTYNNSLSEIVSSFTVPFKKGDVISISGSGLQAGGTRYFTLRDYTGR